MTSQTSSSASHDSSSSTSSQSGEYQDLIDALQKQQQRSADKQLTLSREEDHVNQCIHGIETAIAKLQIELFEAKQRLTNVQSARRESNREIQELVELTASIQTRLLRQTQVAQLSSHKGADSMRCITQNARNAHDRAEAILLTRFLSLGFTSADLEKCKQYIRDEAAIIVHFEAKSLLRHLLRDGIYKTAFETRRCCNEPTSDAVIQYRKRLELKHLFYPMNLPSEQRCRYGYLHWSGDEAGEKSLQQYFGESYMTLDRLKFADKVSITPDGTTCEILDTLEYCCRYLNTLSDTEIKLLRMQSDESSRTSYKAAALRQKLRRSASDDTSRELHVHSPVPMSEFHVASINIPMELKEDKSVLLYAEMLRNRYQLQLNWFSTDQQDYSSFLKEMNED